MTLHDLNDTSPGQSGREKTDHAQDFSAPPAYDEDADHSMLESFKHVSIPPPAPLPDESAVDIRIGDDDVDEDNGGFQSQQSQQSQAGSAWEPLPWVTPRRASRQILSGHLQSCCTITGFQTIEQQAVGKPSGQRSGSLGSSSDAPAPFLPETPAHPSIPELSPLTIEEMMESLPCPGAFFLPSEMEWFAILGSKDSIVDSESETMHHLHSSETPSPLEHTLGPVWRLKGLETIPVGKQRTPLYAVTPAHGETIGLVQAVESFEVWKSNMGDVRLSTIKGSITSIIPLTLLERFRLERLASPRPGLTGEAQLRDAVATLLKVIANAARGEERALSITGKAISIRLGFDTVIQEVLGLLGFQADGRPDDNGKFSLIKPPDMTQIVWKLKMRRAWLEVVLWYQYKQKLVSPELFWKDMMPSIPLLPTFGDPVQVLEQCFGFNQETQVSPYAKYATRGEIDALETLGAGSEAAEGLVELCYIQNTVGLDYPRQIPFYSALQVAARFFAKSPVAQGESDTLQIRLAIEKSKGLVSESELMTAFTKIGIELASIEEMQGVNNDFIVSVYASAVNNVAANKDQVQGYKDALHIISVSRGAPEELEQHVDAPVELSLAKAYEILEVQHDTDDDFISSVFSVSLADSSKSAMECTEALRIISEERKSAVLLKLYRNATGQEEEWEPASLMIPIGLNNIGNTCYLNSVLQYFFAIRELREQVFIASQTEEKEAALTGSEGVVPRAIVVRVGGREVHEKEIQRSLRFVRRLGDLFSNMISSPASAVTPERELAYLALVSPRVEELTAIADDQNVDDDSAKGLESRQEQQHSITIAGSGSGTEKTLVDEPDSMGTVEDKEAQVVREEQGYSGSGASISSMDADGIITPPLPETSTGPPLPPRPVAAHPLDAQEVGQRRNSLMQLGAQQDVSECLDNVMFQVEVALTASRGPSNQETACSDEKSQETKLIDKNVECSDEDDGWARDDDVLRKMFLGRTLQRLEQTGQNTDRKARGDSIHTKREVFTTLPIDVVEEERDIYDGLDGFFEEEILTGSAGESIRRTVTLTDGPAIMQIQLQRVQFDRIKGAYKSQAHLEVGQSLFMDRYLDFDPADPQDVVRLEKRKKGREARRRVAELRARVRSLEPGKSSIAGSLKQTGDFLLSLRAMQRGSDTAAPDGEEASQETDQKTGNKPRSGLPALLDAGLGQYLTEEASRVEEEVRSAQAEILRLKQSVEELWKDEKRLEYILASVFMHRGEASHGHYFLNQRRLTRADTEPSNAWFKYNDQSVTEAQWSDVHRDQSGATPYLLCWVRRDRLGHFDTLCRTYGSDTASSAVDMTAAGRVAVADDTTPRSTDVPDSQQTVLLVQPQPLSVESRTSVNDVQASDDTIMADVTTNSQQHEEPTTTKMLR